MEIIGREGGAEQGIAVVGEVCSTASESRCHEVCGSIQKVFAREQRRSQ